ncbi:MAG: aminotransferase class III-fold pyridoxal phosphate-dependent enzyme [Saprospiraceae bacterium]|nr:aminotransferase class III-fold pyridoxal phosphate-dependent enzyme [Saprospiraceae bacterium]
MNTKYTRLQLSIGKAADVAKELFNVTGKIVQLNGEIDFNYKIICNNSEKYVLKISRPDVEHSYLDFQQKLLEYIADSPEIIAPKVVLDLNGNAIGSVIDQNGKLRYVRLYTWIDGRLWSSVNPLPNRLRFSLGVKSGLLTKALEGFDHPIAHRQLEWDNSQAEWVFNFSHLFDGKQKELILHFHVLIKQRLPQLNKLRKSIIHNDLNDNNILVNTDMLNPEVVTAIDFGDAVYTSIINDLGVAGMYLPIGQSDALAAILPFVKGYNKSFPLQEKELEMLYVSIAIRLVISLTKAAINNAREPENKYHQISTKGAWEVLEKWYSVNETFATYRFRKACGYSVHPEEKEFQNWALTQNRNLNDLFPELDKQKAHALDLSVESSFSGHISDIENIDKMTFRFSQLQKQVPESIIAGGYLEARCFYSTDAYKIESNQGYEYRTIHLGTDFWVPSNTSVAALFDATIFSVFNNENNKDYGPTVILKHEYDKDNFFYTLYGHLNKDCLKNIKEGQKVKAGDIIAKTGEYHENGGWIPHLHFQIILNMLGNTNNFPGVCRPSEMIVWSAVCPDPNLLFRIPELDPKSSKTNKELIDYRKQHLGKGLSLQYNVPIKMVRGDGVYLIDQFGQKYLDTVNNVAHVGHEYPEVVKAGQQQMAMLNTNTRYLHKNINEFTAELLSTLPQKLSVVHFVNSGSEANELALRMVKTATGQKDIIASEVGYHGNTNACIEISSYKFDGKGGNGAPEHTHIIPLPDCFRGKYRGKNTGLRYAEHVLEQINNIKHKGRGLAGFIIEPIISCGGQVVLPKEFLSKAYEHVRNAGGYCISDEVQVGCGRMGTTFWGFELYDVIPDIITIGKPIGNGHPLGAVVCTREIADKFANGMEYFNTFGGNPVSCAIGKVVLDTIKKEKLQENALKVGEYLKKALLKLAKKHPVIADIRGHGLFLGIELTDKMLNPIPEKVSYLANRMKEEGVLMSVDGPNHNVLKIKPPIIFNRKNAEELIKILTKIMKEDFMKL